MFQHIEEFLKMMNHLSSINYGLGYYSEQSFESLHSDMKVRLMFKKYLLFKTNCFQKLWDRVKVGLTHPDFGIRLKNFICAYVSKHI